MGRLIDADALMKRKQEEYAYHDITDSEFEDLINSQPTAYSIEKVVAELKDVFPINPYPNEFTNGRDFAIKKAIEIVRKGGVE